MAQRSSLCRGHVPHFLSCLAFEAYEAEIESFSPDCRVFEMVNHCGVPAISKSILEPALRTWQEAFKEHPDNLCVPRQIALVRKRKFDAICNELDTCGPPWREPAQLRSTCLSTRARTI